MKENVLDVLMYLFENYMDEEDEFSPDRDELKLELQEAGFAHAEVDKALSWLDGLIDLQNEHALDNQQTHNAFRFYTATEQKRLNTECRGFLLFMEQIGVLDPITRETVIDRVMALGADDIGLDHLKWVIMMVLFNRPGHEAAVAWMEDFVFEEASCLH